MFGSDTWGDVSSWEDRIFNNQDSEADECTECELKGNCRNECMEEQAIYNPFLPR